MDNFYDRSRPSAQVCLESLWIHRASIPRSSASRPKPIATNRLVDFIERKKLQVYNYVLYKMLIFSCLVYLYCWWKNFWLAFAIKVNCNWLKSWYPVFPRPFVYMQGDEIFVYSKLFSFAGRSLPTIFHQLIDREKE